jgi:hypothetical protein
MQTRLKMFLEHGQEIIYEFFLVVFFFFFPPLSFSRPVSVSKTAHSSFYRNDYDAVDIFTLFYFILFFSYTIMYKEF